MNLQGLPLSWSHSYLESMFEEYDYNNPKQPWKIHCRDSDGIRNGAWQMKCFHFWWIIEQCLKTGEIGLAIDMDNLPFCLFAHRSPDCGHLPFDGAFPYGTFNSGKFPLVVASAAIPYYPCETGNPRCDGREVAKGINDLSYLVKPKGALIAAIMDETGPRHEGRSLRGSSQFAHAWTVKEFGENVLGGVDASLWEVEEFDTFKNDLSFNVVLRRK